MSIDKEHREFKPWQEDGIVFLNGDWEIWRAENEGTYYYSFGGTMCRNAVDAMSLIEWHMAKLIDYEEFTPWTTSIAFKSGDWEIMRDIFARGGANKHKKYYVKTATGIKKVNMYGLLALDMATCDAATEQEIFKAAEDMMSSDESLRPWPSDKIVFVPLDGVTITRASHEGFYIYHKGYLSKTVKAESLLDSGNAVPLRPVGLAKLAFEQDMTRAQFEADFGGFWMHDDPSSVDSLREVASIWHELCKADSPERLAIKDAYKKLSAPIEKVGTEARECMKCVCALYADVKAFDGDINYIVPLRDSLTLDTLKEAGGKIDAKLSEMYPRLTALSKSVDEDVDKAVDKMSAACDAFKAVTASGLCPMRILPTDLKNEIKALLRPSVDTSAYKPQLTALNGSAPTFVNDICEAATSDTDADGDAFLDGAKHKLNLAVQAAKAYFATSKVKLRDGIAEVYKYIRGANFRMSPLKARAAMLDAFRSKLGKRLNRKVAKSEMRPRTTDLIRFVTSVEICRSPYAANCYSVPLKDGGSLALTVSELVYLGLAEHIV